MAQASDDNLPLHPVRVYLLRFAGLPRRELEALDAALALEEADIHEAFPGRTARASAFWERRFLAVARAREAIRELIHQSME